MCAKGNKQQEYKSALSLQKFAAAKKKKYDKNLKKERAAARRAKRINEYKKLKQKLIEEGKIPAKKVKKKVARYQEITWIFLATRLQSCLPFHCLHDIVGILSTHYLRLAWTAGQSWLSN